MATSPASPSRVRLMLCGVLLVCYVGVVLTATMWPTPLDANYQSTITRLLEILHRHGIPEWFGYGKLEFSANVAMFVPLGFLLALTLPERTWWLAMLLIPAFSGVIEYTQGQWLDARFASGWDVAANTLGGYVGAVLAGLLRAVVHARDRLVIAQALTGSPQRS
ncbi:MAG TPA: VanZ family protein [Propionicimonas sp.]